MKKIQTSKELKLFWDNFQKIYEKNIGCNIHPPFISMCNIAKIRDKKSILELSCGTGTGLLELINILRNKDCDIYGTDISTNMLNASYERLRDINGINISFNDISERNKSTINVFLKECDNEDLIIFEEKKFDVILSNFSLNLVSNPNNMLRECSRVLKDDGICLLSIWGRPENSYFFNLIPNVMKKLKITLPEARSYFHLSNVEKLKNIVLKNGFNLFNYSYFYCPFDILNPSDYYFMLESPTYKEIMNSLSEEQKILVKQEIHNELDLLLNSNNQLLGTEVIIIACRKNISEIIPKY